jgi:hypothetical protein
MTLTMNGAKHGLVLQGFFRRERLAAPAERNVPVSWADKAPRPELLPAKLRPTAQPKAMSAPPPAPVWSRAPRPDLLPGMGRSRIPPLPSVAQGRTSPDVTTSPVPDGLLRLPGSGKPLDDGIRTKMERFFNADFSGVRVHEGAAAQAMGALAFTLGETLYFAPGMYDPTTRAGVELLGHELTHVVQQRDGRVANPYGRGVAIVQDPNLEAEADNMGRQVAAEVWSGLPPNISADRERIVTSNVRAGTARPERRLAQRSSGAMPARSPDGSVSILRNAIGRPTPGIAQPMLAPHVPHCFHCTGILPGAALYEDAYVKVQQGIFHGSLYVISKTHQTNDTLLDAMHHLHHTVGIAQALANGGIVIGGRTAAYWQAHIVCVVMHITASTHYAGYEHFHSFIVFNSNGAVDTGLYGHISSFPYGYHDYSANIAAAYQHRYGGNPPLTPVYFAIDFNNGAPTTTRYAV